MALSPVSLSAGKGVELLVVTLVFAVLATTFVALRLIARRIKRATLGVDDYMICVALFFQYTQVAINVIGIRYGGEAVHIEKLEPAQIVVFIKTNLFAGIILWAATLTTIKISLLFLYISIFVVRPFRIAAYVVMAISIGWFVSVFLEELLLCRPLAFNWDPTIKGGKCADRPAAYLAAGIINLFTDVMVLCLPMRMVWNLQLPRRSKIALSAVFGLGFLVCIITILRIKSIREFDLNDPTWSILSTALWSEIEPTLGIMCACTPLLGPIFGSVFHRIKTADGKNYGSYEEYSYGKDSKVRRTKEEYEDSYPLAVPKTSTVIKAETLSKEFGREGKFKEGQRLERIQVEKDWQVYHA